MNLNLEKNVDSLRERTKDRLYYYFKDQRTRMDINQLILFNILPLVSAKVYKIVGTDIKLALILTVLPTSIFLNYVINKVIDMDIEILKQSDQSQ